MSSSREGRVLVTLVAVLVGGCSRPETQEPLSSRPGVRVERARARLTPAQVGAVYLTLVNTSAREDRLLSAESPTAERVEMHEVVAQGELLRMLARPEGFVVPAGGRVELTPGGKHLMLYSVRDAPASLPLTLHFEKAGTLQVVVPISPLGADEP